MEHKIHRGMPGIPTVPPQLPMLLILLGAAAMAFGVLLIFNHWLLVWMVASVFLLVGAMLLLAGLRAKRMLG